MSMKGNRIYAGAVGMISDHWRPNCFFEGDNTRGAGILFQYFTIRTEKIPVRLFLTTTLSAVALGLL